MKTACKNGNCEVLFDDSLECEFRKRSKLMVCNYMNQDNGLCLHRLAGRNRTRNPNQQNVGFRRMSAMSWAERVGNK